MALYAQQGTGGVCPVGGPSGPIPFPNPTHCGLERALRHLPMIGGLLDALDQRAAQAGAFDAHLEEVTRAH